jgi:hypothetical protein
MKAPADHPAPLPPDRQAKGVLAERNAMSMEAAFDSLRLYARDHNIKLTNLAVAVVHRNFNPAFRPGRP